MFLLNLTLAEFVAIFSTVSAVVLTLYLLDRSRRRQVVATLRFWTPAGKPSELKHRRKIQQPLSLILQLLSLLLLLLALAQLQLGSPEKSARDHVMVLDTSAWMGARAAGGTLLDEAKKSALAWLRSLPRGDRVMVVRADALATPATRFESRRGAVEAAIGASAAGSSALNLDRALEFAAQMQRMNGRARGEIVYAGAGRIPEQETVTAEAPNLRLLPVARVPENCGLRKIGLRPSAADPLRWQILVAARNYGQAPRTVPVRLYFGNALIGAQPLTLPPGEERSVTFEYRTRAGGWIEARLESNDALAADDRAVLELPAQNGVRVLVYTDSPDHLRPLLTSNPLVEATFRPTAAFDNAAQADIFVFDRFKPPIVPQAPIVWMEPPQGTSPIPVRRVAKDVALTRWSADHELGAGLRLKGLRLESTEIYEPAKGDITVAECEQGPVILARPGKHKTIALGFHPVRSALKYELTTPLLFANLLRWMAPPSFRHWELNGGTVGTVSLELEAETDPAAIRVLTDNDAALPFTVQGQMLRFFAGAPQTVRVNVGRNEYVYSLTLPEVAAATWEPPRQARRGVPPPAPAGPAARDLWRILALLGALGLVLEWLLFGRGRFQPGRLRLFPREPARTAASGRMAS